MARTFIEKLIAAHAEGDPRAGDEVELRVDLRSARDAGGAGVVAHFDRTWPGERVDDPQRTCFTFDCAGAGGAREATDQQTCRRFAREQGITVFDVNRGIGTHLAIDEGLVLPGDTVVGTDSHLNIYGAVGALGLCRDAEGVAEAFRHGTVRIRVPETLAVRLEGTPGPAATAKDVALEVLRTLGPDGARGRAIEYRGDIVARLGLDERITLASMTTEAGGLTAWLEPNEAVLDHFARVNRGREPRLFTPDPGAPVSDEIVVRLDGLQPRIALPGSPHEVVDVAEAVGRPIDTAFLGSCTNGRDTDIEAAARVVGEGAIARHTLLTVVPSTAGVFGRLWTSGALRALFDAGAVIRNPGCGGCAPGQAGTSGDGEVQVSSANRNFHGRQGTGETYLASPATVAASAVAGKITVPPA